MIKSGNPADGCFQIILPDGRTADETAAHLVSHASTFTEVAFGIAHPRSGKDGIAQLLLGELCAGNVDGLKPIELLAGGAGAEIHHQWIVQEIGLLFRLQVVEIIPRL